MSLRKFLISRTFFTNLLIAIILVIAIIIATMTVLRNYTHHGEGFPVPNLIGMNEQDVLKNIGLAKLNYTIIDSVYVNFTGPGNVVDQVPKPGFKVKQNRTILLTINAKAPEKVVLPNLRHISFRQARVLIENKGLELGEITYKPSEFNDLVLNAYSGSEEIFAGNTLEKGSVIDLEIGQGATLEKTTIPDLGGLNITDATLIIKDAMLNVGVIIFDKSVKTYSDTTNAKVWKQSPGTGLSGPVDLGASIDIWVTVDEDKLSNLFEN